MRLAIVAGALAVTAAAVAAQAATKVDATVENTLAGLKLYLIF
jgi:hypothetical protein